MQHLVRERGKKDEGGGHRSVSGCSESSEKGRHIHSQLEQAAELKVLSSFNGNTEAGSLNCVGGGRSIGESFTKS